MGKLTHTVKGPIASFRSADKADIESLKFHFLPKQADGTPSPENPIPIEGWTGVNGYGAGENLLPFDSVISDGYTQTLDGLTATYNNGIVHITGNHTKSGWTNIIDFYSVWQNKNVTLPPGTYNMANGLCVVCKIDDAGYVNKSGEFTVNESAIIQGFYVPVYGEGEKDITVPLILSLGTTRPKKYEPYYPIKTIPITFPTLGTNLFDISTGIQYERFNLRVARNSGYGVPFRVKKGIAYTISVNDGSVVEELRIQKPWSADTYQVKYNSSSITYIPNEDMDIALNFYWGNGRPETATDFMIEYGGVAHRYVPYGSPPYENDNVFYGGYADIVAGELVCEYVCLTTTWGQGSENTVMGDTERRRYPLVGPTPSGGQWVTQKCNITRYGYDFASDYVHVYFTINGYGYVFLPIDTDNDTVIQVTYKLATPIRIPIPAEDLKTFLDYNNFWSDTNDDTEVEYAFADRLSERKLIMDTPHIESASGAVASFSTDMKAPIVDLKAYFTPVQEGSGDPSPVNERPIHGWTGFNVKHCEKGNYCIPTTAYSPGQIIEQKEGMTVQYLGNGKYHVFGTTGASSVQSSYIPIYPFDTEPSTNSNRRVRFNNNSSLLNIVFGFSNGSSDSWSLQTADRESGSYVAMADKTIDRIYFGIQANTMYDAILRPEFYVYDSLEIIPIEFPATKNLFNTFNYGQKYGVGFSVEEGSWHFDDVVTDNTAYVSNTDTFPAGTYTLSAKCSGTGIEKFRMVCSSSSCGGTWNNYYQGYFIDPANGENKITFTSTEEFTIKLVFVISSGHRHEPGTIYNIQLERGSTATVYEPYGTAYSGYVDLVRGKLVVEWYGISALWKDIKNTRYSSITDQHEGRLYFPYPLYKASTPGSGASEKAICNVAKWAYADIAYQSTGHFYVSGGFNDGEYVAYIILPESTSDDTAITVVAEMVIPIEYDLTPQQLKTLKGLNNIWSDTNGNVDVKYWTH